MLKKHKTFRSYQEQILFMRERGIEVPDEQAAIESLSTFSYYSLVNLNKHLYGGLDLRHFAGGPSIVDLQLAHMLNMNFYQTVLKGILYVEASFKTKLAYLISRKFGSASRDDIDNARDNYLFRGYYDPRNKQTTGTLRSLRNKLKLLRAPSNIHSYSHHFLTGNRQLPPWIFIHDVEFGLAIQWFNILRKHDQEEVLKKMLWGETGYDDKAPLTEDDEQFFDAALDILRQYRNIIAHGERVFESEITNALPELSLFSILPESVLSQEEYDQGIGRNDPFACLLAIALFIHEPILMLSFLTELQSQLDFAQLMKETMAPGSLDIHTLLGIPPFTMERLIAISHHRFGELSRAFFNPTRRPEPS